MIRQDPSLRKAIKAEARKNFSMSAARRPRNLMGLKQEEPDNLAKKLARDLRKKYGYDRSQAGGPETGKKKGAPVDLLTEMQHIFERDVRGMAPEIPRSPSSRSQSTTGSFSGAPPQSAGLSPVKKPTPRGSKAVYPLPEG
jgi:hypothetical protein